MAQIKDIEALAGDIQTAYVTLDIDNKKQTLQDRKAQSSDADFWSDQQRASKIMQEIATLEEQVSVWTKLQKNSAELLELAKLDDVSLSDELDAQLANLQQDFEAHKRLLQLNGHYDDHDALLSIYAGAGGTDAQDWVQMLLRMYTRWAEQHHVAVTVLNESAGEEAGLKSVELELKGPYVFGKLKGEHGVHRLVRLSPFNADAKRQTSFAKVDVLPKIDTPDEVPIDETDLKIDVFRAGGHGGQSVNTTDSAVRVTHLPTGIVVSIQNERSQIQNKETALTILRSKLAQLQLEQHAEKISELKGPNEQAAWGNQIRSYVLHPYTMVKDLRTRHETVNAQSVLDGELDPFINAFLETTLSVSE